MPELAGEDFTRLFTEFQYTAFRLETRDHYGVPEEDEPFRRFLAGEPAGTDWLQPWLDTIASVTAQGRRVERVRLASSPPSDYLRFELSLTPYNLAAGEDIRFLGRARAAGLGLPDEDFWLFDSTRLALLRFDQHSRFLGADIVDDPAIVVRHCYWRDAAWHCAETYETYQRAERSTGA